MVERFYTRPIIIKTSSPWMVRNEKQSTLIGFKVDVLLDREWQFLKRDQFGDIFVCIRLMKRLPGDTGRIQTGFLPGLLACG